ncbi:MAG: type II toxin-antitoxin system RelE/ParE family toxin [Saprospiraceae bacterium]|nr:type II toxin-antitoxin system RelE/ParE family toxin [Saprospiraceae bacterium]MBK9722872.1 type II toxin-antitoxin system RelE/ParE family toxin [Saprospiraceae bacterium]MBK9726738.1 type II toxin-antitoxin system RelE/ParE family toxin [Saprospiraceae bacterium]
MAALNKPIVVILDDEAEAFFENLNEKTRNKFYVLFDKTESGYRGEWFEPLKETDGLWEFRLRFNKNFYRLIAFWDRDEKVETLIIATHGFLKKTNKTPSSEIKKAEIIKKKYFKNKRSN